MSRVNNIDVLLSTQTQTSYSSGARDGFTQPIFYKKV